MDKAIQAILAQPDPVSTGKFVVKRSASDGTPVEHRTSWGLGMLRQASRSRYRDMIGQQPPDWVEAVHPAKAARLYKLAAENGLALPETMPYPEVPYRRERDNHAGS